MDASEAPVARAAPGHQDDSAVAASSIRGGQGTEPNGGGGPMTANTSQTQEAGDRNQEAQSEDGVDRSRGSQPHAVGLNDSQSHDNWLDDLAESYTSVGSTAAIMNQRYRVHLQKRHQRQIAGNPQSDELPQEPTRPKQVSFDPKFAPPPCGGADPSASAKVLSSSRKSG